MNINIMTDNNEVYNANYIPYDIYTKKEPLSEDDKIYEQECEHVKEYLDSSDNNTFFRFLSPIATLEPSVTYEGINKLVSSIIKKEITSKCEKYKFSTNIAISKNSKKGVYKYRKLLVKQSNYLYDVYQYNIRISEINDCKIYGDLGYCIYN